MPEVIAMVKGPEKAYESLVDKGVQSAAKTLIRVFHQPVYAECYIGFGGVLSMVVAGGLADATYSNPVLCPCGALPGKPAERPTHRWHPLHGHLSLLAAAVLEHMTHLINIPTTFAVS